MKLPERITVCEVGLRDCALRGSWATRETAMLLPSRFARSFGSLDKKFCSKVKGIGFLLHI